MPPENNTTTIHSYPLTGRNSQDVIKQALSRLKPHFPVCLPLYRRLQFGRFLDATVLLTNLDNLGNDKPEDGAAWLFAFVDRSCRPETEVWLFGSWEGQARPLSEDQRPAIEELLTALVREMKALDVPKSIHQDVLDASGANAPANDTDSAGFSRNDYAGHARDPDIMLWGAVHKRSVALASNLGFITRRFKTGLVANHTFLWDVDALPPPHDLPAGLQWGELELEDFELVRARTQIPRQDRTLSVLPNLGIFNEEAHDLIAWAFVGLDASLSTLHVEPQYRGRGLAKVLTTKLFKEKMEMFWEDEVARLAHGYVIDGNEASERMCRSLGGKSDWQVYWLRADLGQV